MENLFNVNQAAFILKVHPLTIRRYIKEGKLKAIRIGGNVRIKESDLQSFNKEVSPAPAKKSLIFKKNLIVAKAFANDDPFFRLRGLGAAVPLSNK
ncbi:MAG TPA: helix-turn-helix domain-containing protein [Patescibacteria group bacterium]|nr:helix-turn-helix domain-containing protein [Patescibacteria group bacterium]